MNAPTAEYELVVAAPGKQGRRFSGSDDGFRVDFEVSYGGEGEPPKSSFTVYNPPPAFADAVRLSGTDAIVTLSGGVRGFYEGSIFSGKIVKDGVQFSVGADKALKLTCVAGHAAIVSSKVSDISGSDETPTEVVTRLCGAAGALVGTLDLPDGASVGDRAYYGPPVHELESLARKWRRSLVFDGQRFHMLQLDVGIPKGMQQIPLFRRTSGLIGTPELIKDGVKVQTLIYPQMRVGTRFIVQYLDPYTQVDVRRELVCKEVRLTGTTHGSNNTCDITARISRVLSTVPT